LPKMSTDVLVIDTLTVPSEGIVAFAVEGPMVDIDLAPGMVSHFGGATEPWSIDAAYVTPTFSDPPTARLIATLVANSGTVGALIARPGRDARFGNAGGFDHVAIDVLAVIAASFGATVTTVAHELAAHAAAA